MHGRPLSYDECLAVALEMFRHGESVDEMGDGAGYPLSENEAGLLKSWISGRREGCMAALTEDTPNGRKLSEIGAELAGALLSRATPTPTLEWPILKAIWDRRLIRMNPMESWIIDESALSNGTLRVLLSQRPANDPYFPSQWHNPGNYVGGGKVRDGEIVGAETVAEAYERCILKETGARLKNFTVIGIGDFVHLSRDPELSVISLVTLDTKPRLSDTIRWYAANELPENMIEHSRAMLEQRVVPWVQLMLIDAPKMCPEAREALRRMVVLMQPLRMSAE